MVPPRAVPEVLREVLAHVPAVLLEKPIAIDLAAAAEVRTLVQRHDATVLMGHNGLHHAGFAAIKSALSTRSIGTVISITAESSGWLQFRPGDFRKDKLLTGGGVWMDTGSHLIYTLRDLFGAPVVCNAMMRNLARSEMEGEDHALLHLLFAGGQIASVETSYARKRPGWSQDWPEGFFLQFTVWGTEGALRYSLCPEAKLEVSTSGSWDELVTATPFVTSFERQMRHFLEVVQGKTEPRATVADGLAVLDVLQQAYAVAARGSLEESTL